MCLSLVCQRVAGRRGLLPAGCPQLVAAYGRPVGGRVTGSWANPTPAIPVRFWSTHSLARVAISAALRSQVIVLVLGGGIVLRREAAPRCAPGSSRARHLPRLIPARQTSSGWPRLVRWTPPNPLMLLKLRIQGRPGVAVEHQRYAGLIAPDAIPALPSLIACRIETGRYRPRSFAAHRLRVLLPSSTSSVIL